MKWLRGLAFGIMAGALFFSPLDSLQSQDAIKQVDSAIESLPNQGTAEKSRANSFPCLSTGRSRKPRSFSLARWMAILNLVVAPDWKIKKVG